MLPIPAERLVTLADRIFGKIELRFATRRAGWRFSTVVRRGSIEHN